MEDVTPKVRTHSVRQVVQHHDTPSFCRYVLECRGCNEQWPVSTDRDAIAQEPCGTRSENTSGN